MLVIESEMEIYDVNGLNEKKIVLKIIPFPKWIRIQSDE